MRRPLVAVPAMRSPRVQGLRRDGLVMAQRIAECVLRAGGEPLVLAPDDPREVLQRLASFDALLLPGGRDVDPSVYSDDDPHPSTDDPDVEQDEADLAAVRAAVDLGLPTLAICRGLQVLDVAYGGTLVQHLPDDGIHREGLHPVDLVAGSRVAAVMGGARVAVSSYHHQAVDRVASCLEVTGRASDGCVEVLEHRTAPVLAVQWHPEDDAHTNPRQQALFDDLVERARRGRDASGLPAAAGAG